MKKSRWELASCCHCCCCCCLVDCKKQSPQTLDWQQAVRPTKTMFFFRSHSLSVVSVYLCVSRHAICVKRRLPVYEPFAYHRISSAGTATASPQVCLPIFVQRSVIVFVPRISHSFWAICDAVDATCLSIWIQIWTPILPTVTTVSTTPPGWLVGGCSNLVSGQREVAGVSARTSPAALPHCVRGFISSNATRTHSILHFIHFILIFYFLLLFHFWEGSTDSQTLRECLESPWVLIFRARHTVHGAAGGAAALFHPHPAGQQFSLAAGVVVVQRGGGSEHVAGL